MVFYVQRARHFPNTRDIFESYDKNYGFYYNYGVREIIKTIFLYFKINRTDGYDGDDYGV